MFVLFLGLQLVFVSSCKNESGKSHLSVRMTDAPGNFDAVMVDVQSVEVIGSNGSTVILNTNNRIYNLLDLSNGVDTLLATGDLDAGTISQIRLILGANNSVKVDGIVYPLSTPSAMQSGLKLQVNKTFEPGVTYSILLDFDANQSIVLQGNGTYQLKPVIRTIETAISGSIKGSISVVGSIATVKATSNGVTYTSVTNMNGQFILAGLPAGTYDVTVTPDLPLLPVTKTGVVVTVGASLNLGIITL
ncbi:MAG: DUF4382 domain-containing protein [Paludibacter sp.]|nr:DUF4382 domain-containing protein [Paludibacter sp.]